MSQTSESAIISLIGEIYEASYRPEHWDYVLARLCRLIDAKSGGLLMEDKVRQFRAIIGSHNIPGIPKVAYRLGLGKRDVVFQVQASQPVGSARQVARHDDIRQSNPWYYRVFMKPNDMGYIAAINFFNDNDWHAGIGLHRSFQARPFGDDELRLLNVLTPHFQRALSIQRELFGAQSRKQSIEAALSRLMLGIIVLDGKDQVAYRNAVAEQFMSQHRAIRIEGDRLSAHYREESRALCEALAVLRKGKNNNGQYELVLGLRHPDRPRPLTVMGALAGEAPDSVSGVTSQGQIVLYLSDPDSRFCAPEADLMAAFGLTHSEASVVIALVNGLSLDDVGRQRGACRETVRSQLKCVFEKLGVSRQQDVVRVILNSELGRKEFLPRAGDCRCFSDD